MDFQISTQKSKIQETNKPNSNLNARCNCATIYVVMRDPLLRGPACHPKRETHRFFPSSSFEHRKQGSGERVSADTSLAGEVVGGRGEVVGKHQGGEARP
jgi:hypothetical protein